MSGCAVVSLVRLRAVAGTLLGATLLEVSCWLVPGDVRMCGSASYVLGMFSPCVLNIDAAGVARSLSSFEAHQRYSQEHGPCTGSNSSNKRSCLTCVSSWPWMAVRTEFLRCKRSTFGQYTLFFVILISELVLGSSSLYMHDIYFTYT